jgi:formylmethanofuran dehydrogenase subunit C
VNTNISLTGEASSYFGHSLASGDFNADGRTDLIVGADTYSTNTGRAYLFYNDGSLPTTAATADVIVTGEATGNYFGRYLSAGDVNADGKTDVLIGAGSATKAYVFYNDGSYPSLAANSDVVINGISVSNISIGDLNTDGKQDILIAHFGYGSNGRAYLFYADGTNNFGSAACTGSVPTSCTGSNADIIVDGTGGKRLGAAVVGDANADGRSDMLLGGTNNTAGGLYVLYNDGTSFGTAACTTACSVTNADVTISGENTGDNFASSIVVGDMNNDGRADIVTVAQSYSSNTGRVYFFYNDGSYPAAAGNADSIMTGEGTASYPFGDGLNVADMNADGRVDLVVGAYGYGGGYGRAYIVYNDEAYPSGLVNADIVIIGEISSGYFGSSLTPGDFNADGKIDLIIGAHNYSSGTGRVYLYETRDNFVWQLQPQSSLSGGLRTNPSFSGQELKITGEVGTGGFGTAMASGDFNADGKTDLAVGAFWSYSSDTGRVYIFYNDGHLAAAATNADVVIIGEPTLDYFATALASGDFNADGKTDLSVGAQSYSSGAGCAYIFYNDGSIPTTATTADVIITGEASSYFGGSLASGDFNADGKTDFAVGAYGYSTDTGRAYIFYNGSIITENASGADIIITGEASSYFAISLTSGDFNADGKTDFAVGAYGYSTNTGRTYLFYNGSIITENASGADIIITGETTGNLFGYPMVSGDFNADGKTDLAVGAWGYSTDTGRAYLFYNGSIITENASGADIIITGETTSNQFGYSLASGDFNADGKTDLAVGAYIYSANTGRSYLFYNDGSIPTTAATADIIITGETESNFGANLVSGDFNVDGKTDLAVGAYGYGSNRGRVYMYTFNDGMITGEATSNNFGANSSLASGDFNADGKTDLAVGAWGYSTDTGRAYIFYNDGSLPTTAATADIIITGETTSDYFGSSLASGDFNADGKTDLSVSAVGYSSSTGRAYLFYNGSIITENASGADIIITGETTGNLFGYPMVSGDFNADGKTDLSVGAWGYSTDTGRAYLFYNGSIITENASGADIIITGETTGDSFGRSLASGDWNADGKTDLAVGSYAYSFFTGRAYIFYNGSIVTENASGADVRITGETATDYFGYSFASGDWNADGKTDLIVGSYGYSSGIGRAYIFYNGSIVTENASGADIIITGEASSYFCYSLASGDFNADGKTDLAVGANGYSTDTGRVYLFYNDGSIPTTAATADIIITGETTSDYFGSSLASGDFNADGKTDLSVGAESYSSGTGRVYIFITEAKTEESLQQWKSKGTLRAKGNFQVK